jgi:hypothetical protein
MFEVGWSSEELWRWEFGEGFRGLKSLLKIRNLKDGFSESKFQNPKASSPLKRPSYSPIFTSTFNPYQQKAIKSPSLHIHAYSFPCHHHQSVWNTSHHNSRIYAAEKE